MEKKSELDLALYYQEKKARPTVIRKDFVVEEKGLRALVTDCIAQLIQVELLRRRLAWSKFRAIPWHNTNSSSCLCIEVEIYGLKVARHLQKMGFASLSAVSDGKGATA